jgi:oligosaccharide repeat unit polymerase
VAKSLWRHLLSPLIVLYMYSFGLILWILIPNDIFLSIGAKKEYQVEMLLYLFLFLLSWYLGYFISSRYYNKFAKPFNDNLSLNKIIVINLIKRISLLYIFLGSIVFSIVIFKIARITGFLNFLLENGVLHAYLFKTVGQIKGITILSQLIPAGLIIISYIVFKEKLKLNGLDKLIIVYGLLITLYRGFYLERTALLEVVIPLLVIYYSCNLKKLKLRKIIYGLVVFVFIYIIGEYFRTYSVLKDAKNYSWYGWGLFRLGQYVSSVFYYFLNLSEIETLKPAYGSNFFRGIFQIIDIFKPYEYTSYQSIYNSNYGLSGYTTLTVAGDYYVDGKFLGCCYAFIQSFIITFFYKCFERRTPIGMLIYPTLLVGNLLMWYVIYINTNRGTGIIVAILFAFYISKRKNKSGNINNYQM